MQLKLRWKTRLCRQTIYTCGHLLSVSSSRKKEIKEKNDDFGEMQTFSVVFVTSVSQSQCHSFLADISLVIHISYYIAVYLNVVKSCIWFGHV